VLHWLILDLAGDIYREPDRAHRGPNQV
jgi:hypothetical protein